MNTTPIKRIIPNKRLNFTPKKPKIEHNKPTDVANAATVANATSVAYAVDVVIDRDDFQEYENALKDKKFQGRGCYIVAGIYVINGIRLPFVKCGFTDSLFSFWSPIQKKTIRGRIYTIIQDLRQMEGVSYAKIDEILAFFTEAEGSVVPIKCFETELLKRTRDWKITVGNKKEYRDFSKMSEILDVANDLHNEFSEYFNKAC